MILPPPHRPDIRCHSFGNSNRNARAYITREIIAFHWTTSGPLTSPRDRIKTKPAARALSTAS